MDALHQAGSRADFDWNAWVGIPYYAVGNCWEFLRPILRKGLGAELPSFGDEPGAWREQAGQLPHWRLISLAEVHPFDVLVFELSLTKPPHVGVVIDDRSFLHCPLNSTSVVDTYERAYWRKKFQEAYRYHR